MPPPDYNTLTLFDLLRGTPDIYLIFNPSLEIIEVSKAFEKVTNLKRKEIIGENLEVVFKNNLNTAQAIHLSLTRVLNQKIHDSMSIVPLNFSCSEKENRFWSIINTPISDEKTQVQFILLKMEDVTSFIQFNFDDGSPTSTNQNIFRVAQELDEANKILRFKEERFRLLVEGTKDYALFMLDTHGIITTWNSGAEKIKGYKAKEIIGQHFSIFYSDEARNNHHPEKELQSALKNGRYEEEGWRVKKDGTPFLANIIITPLYDEKKKHIGFGKVTRDLTELKKTEQLKNEFISVVSHELRTPLTSIQASISILLHLIESGSIKERSLLNIASQNCKRLSQLINDILYIERLEEDTISLNLTPTNLTSLIHDSIELIKPYAEKFDVKVVLSKEIPLAYVEVNPQRIQQVLNNLISNAIKFSSKNSTVHIFMKKVGDNVEVAVADQGIGISEEFKHRIFQRFSQEDGTTTRQKDGTGLGLAICKKIIDQSEGTLNFTSEANKGATFYFQLPLVNDKNNPKKVK